MCPPMRPLIPNIGITVYEIFKDLFVCIYYVMHRGHRVVRINSLVRMRCCSNLKKHDKGNMLRMIVDISCKITPRALTQYKDDILPV